VLQGFLASVQKNYKVQFRKSVLLKNGFNGRQALRGFSLHVWDHVEKKSIAGTYLLQLCSLPLSSLPLIVFGVYFLMLNAPLSLFLVKGLFRWDASLCCAHLMPR
jgi:hypothetical protein